MLIGFQTSRPFWRRRRRRAAGERGAWRPTSAPPQELGGWRRPPPAARSAAPPGNARPAVVSAASAPPVGTPARAPAAAEIVLEHARPRDPVDAPSRDQRQLVEQLRPACQALSAAASAGAGRRRRLILVTSPAAGEGKSLTAVGLALGLCRVARRPVLLVDGDGHTAGAAGLLGWPPAPGLWDALAGEVALDGLIGHSGLDDLWFLPPGRRLAATPEVAACQRLPGVMRALLLREPSGLVVIDGPPLLSGVAAAALAACAGQVVLMVAAGRTSRQAIAESLTRLGERDHLYAVFARAHAATSRADGMHAAAERADVDPAARCAGRQGRCRGGGGSR